MRAMLLMLCALAVFTAQAQIYKKVLPDGSVVFTDEPSPGAEPIRVEPLPTYKAPPRKQKAEDTSGAPADSAATQPATYKRFVIESPVNDATIRDNAGNVAIALTVEPALATEQGHTVSLFLDGRPVVHGATSTTLSLSAVDRGTHTVEAALIDAQGKTLKRTPPLVFHLMRHTTR